MEARTLRQVEEALRRIDPERLREMAYRTAHSHINICELTSRVGDRAHIDADEMRDRVEELTVGQLAALLAPDAWMSIDMRQRLG